MVLSVVMTGSPAALMALLATPALLAQSPPGAPPVAIAANPNRVPAGTLANGVLTQTIVQRIEVR